MQLKNCARGAARHESRYGRKRYTGTAPRPGQFIGLGFITNKGRQINRQLHGVCGEHCSRRKTW